MLEHSLREDLNKRAPRVMAVLRPIKVVLENYPEGQVEELEAVNNPEDPSMGTRKVPFSRELYIEQDDFREEPPKGFFRLSPGQEVRLRYAYIIKCIGVVKDPRQVTFASCAAPTTRKPKAVRRKAGAKSKRQFTGYPQLMRLGRSATLRSSFRQGGPRRRAGGSRLARQYQSESLERFTACRVEPF